MTTLAKIEANQRNGELSTGPRTVEGKAIVARNATKHGIFAAVPVIPGECPEQWEAHRAGVVSSLAPAGLLEINFAERAALLLWRLQRLARYEAETVAAGFVEKVVVPPLPPTDDEFGQTNPPSKQQAREDQLRDTRRELRDARKEVAEVILARDFFQAQHEFGEGDSVSSEVAEYILLSACGRAQATENLRSDPPEFGTKSFLRKLGLAEPDPSKTDWTRALVRHGLDVYAGYAREPAPQFADAVRLELEESAEELTRKVRRLDGEVTAITWLLDGGKEHSPAKLLPSDGREERIAKYERHLHSLLTSTLHELERLQARRDGETIPPPMVTDINVRLENGLT